MKIGFRGRLEGEEERMNEYKGREVSNALEQKDSKWMEGEKEQCHMEGTDGKRVITGS